MHMLTFRPRRNRKSAALRALVQENRLNVKDFIYPLFIKEGAQAALSNPSMPGVSIYCLESLIKEAYSAYLLGIPAVILFPIITKEKKSDLGSYALREDGVMPQAIYRLKQEIPDLCVICDVALDPYTTHGHDGIINDKGDVDNDLTVEKLQKISLIFAQAGVDMVAPSDMMDGRVGAIRSSLDQHKFIDVGILSYTAKYASAFYGPYRDTLNSHVAFGSKKSYQMNPANIREALWEATLDQKEGADILMVKPALPYLDIIAKLREKSSLPIAAFQVSGEYSMIMAAAERGWMNAQDAFYEALLSMKRAGADMIVTYAAKKMAEQMRIEA